MKLKIGTVVALTITKKRRKKTAFGIISAVTACGVAKGISEPEPTYYVLTESAVIICKRRDLYTLFQTNGETGLKQTLNKHRDKILLALVKEVLELRSKLDGSKDGADSIFDHIGM